MGKILVVAEKPSAGKDIQELLRKSSEKQSGEQQPLPDLSEGQPIHVVSLELKEGFLGQNYMEMLSSLENLN